MYRRNSPNGFCSSNPSTNSHSTFYHGAMWGDNEFRANSAMYENLNSPGVNNSNSQYSPSAGMMCQPPNNINNNYHNNHNSSNHPHQLIYPHYNSLKINKNEKYLINQALGESKTLGRYSNTNSYPKSLTNSFANINLASDGKNNFKSEHCLNWLENTENIDSIESHMKEIDTNIKLLTWKMKHLENLKLQKSTMTKQMDTSDSHQSDSPPPLSDFLKPELSIMSTDDGFESVADASNNASRLQISNLESQLRKQELTMKMYEAMLNKSKEQVNLMKSQFKCSKISLMSLYKK
ncbi:hypothetical protein HELRODRAFT_170098 [Helobdella robusta]|uniref:Uncharacterized protein n=1 Tax=Helobdella robusta TaxID=6412 RepID=T1F2M3_HELRO|nr:hypothetical protein HELRODRAFT_170098 [Helobdella robusta]ESO07554.1 hypothetical protein HELRODRAFT_170098 [Helobdella robusta]